MPTVSNRDLSGHWNEQKGAGESTLPWKRFKEGHNLNVLPSTPASAAEQISEEHGYAVTQRFISSNSYHGYHPVVSAGNVEDCSMDTSENAANLGLNPDYTCASAEWVLSRKRCLDGGMDFDADTMSVSKRVRLDSVQGNFLMILSQVLAGILFLHLLPFSIFPCP